MCNCSKGQRNTSKGRAIVAPRGVSAPRNVTPRPAKAAMLTNTHNAQPVDRLDAARRRVERLRRQQAVNKKLKK